MSSSVKARRGGMFDRKMMRGNNHVIHKSDNRYNSSSSSYKGGSSECGYNTAATNNNTGSATISSNASDTNRNKKQSAFDNFANDSNQLTDDTGIYTPCITYDKYCIGYNTLASNNNSQGSMQQQKNKAPQSNKGTWKEVVSYV